MKALLKAFVICILLSLSAFVFSVSAVAHTEKEFSFSEENSEKDRLCTVELYAEGVEDVGAFVASFEYDSETLDFRKAEAVCMDAQCSAFCETAGKVNCVYFCKCGQNAYKKTALMSFEFKSLNEGSTEILLQIHDAVDSKGNSIENIGILNGSVKVTETVSEDNQTKLASSVSYQGEFERSLVGTELTKAAESSKKFLEVEGNESSRMKDLFVSLSVALVMVLTVFVAYRAGVKKQQSRNFYNSKLLEMPAEDIKPSVKAGKKNEEIN